MGWADRGRGWRSLLRYMRLPLCMFAALAVLAVVGTLLLRATLLRNAREAATAFSRSCAAEEQGNLNVYRTLLTFGTSALEQRLEDILKTMDGVGNVRVMITVKDKGEKVVAKDNTTSNSSTTSEDGLVSNDYSSESTTVYDGEDTPYETKELLPKVEGVVVVAEGAGNAAVETEIYETVMALFEVDAHKISVGKMRLQEGT